MDINEEIKELNKVLESMNDINVRWWNYTASHKIFEIFLEGDTRQDNLVIFFKECIYIGYQYQGKIISKPEEQFAKIATGSNKKIRIYNQNLLFEEEKSGLQVVCESFVWKQGDNVYGNFYDYNPFASIGANSSFSPSTKDNPSENIKELNEILESMKNKDVRWWYYTVSHTIFQILIGDPRGEDNLFIIYEPCNYISGPVEWKNHNLKFYGPEDQLFKQNVRSEPFKIIAKYYPLPANYTILQDEKNGFYLEAYIPGWVRNINLFEPPTPVL